MEKKEKLVNKFYPKFILLLGLIIIVSFKKIDFNDLIIETEINNEFKLRNKFKYGILNSYDLKLSQDKTGEEYIIFTNALQNEYLKMIKNEGSEDGIFSRAEIGRIRNKKFKVLLPTKFRTFETNSKIQLGMSIEDLKKTKGKNYSLSILNNDTTLSYFIDLTINDKLSKEFKMTTYFLNLSVKNNRVSKINFGFDEP